MRVLKFGGTSVADAERLRHVAHLVCAARRYDPIVVVVSALAGVTDALCDLARGAAGGLPQREALNSLALRHLDCLGSVGGAADDRRGLRLVLDDLEAELAAIVARRSCNDASRDAVLACGERMSTVLAAAALSAVGISAQRWDTRELVVTDSRFGRARVAWPLTQARLRHSWQRTAAGTVPVVTGFIAADPQGRTTTLGRGGSDTSASLIAAALEAQAIEIWSDVDGVLSVPPSCGVRGDTLPRLSYEEARQAARFGAKVLHPDTVAPAARKNIPIEVRNTFRPEGLRTVIGQPATCQGDGARMVTCVETARLVSLAEDSTPDGPQADDEALPCQGPAPFPNPWVVLSPSKVGCDVRTTGRVRDGVSVVALIGDGIAARPSMRTAVRDTLRGARIPLFASAAATSAAVIAVVVPRGLRQEAVRVLHGTLVAPQRSADRAVAEGGEHHG